MNTTAEHHLMRCEQKVLYWVTVFSHTFYYLRFKINLKKTIREDSYTDLTNIGRRLGHFSEMHTNPGLDTKNEILYSDHDANQWFSTANFIEWAFFTGTSFDGSKLMLAWLVAWLHWIFYEVW